MVSHVLPESWFEDDPVSRTLSFVGVNQTGVLFLRTGTVHGGNSGDFLAAVERGIELKFTLGLNTYTFNGISETGETEEPYAWTPDNVADARAIRRYLNLVSSPYSWHSCIAVHCHN